MRISKQIKLTDHEFEVVENIVKESVFNSIKCFSDALLIEFIESSKKVENPGFLSAAKSGKYRTIWFDNLVVDAIKDFSLSHDASENAVIYTAVKRRLNINVKDKND